MSSLSSSFKSGVYSESRLFNVQLHVMSPYSPCGRSNAFVTLGLGLDSIGVGHVCRHARELWQVEAVLLIIIIIRNFYSSSKTDSRFSRSLKVTTGHWNDTFFWREHPIVSYQCHAWLGATQYSAACPTHIRCTLNWTAGAGRQGGRQEKS